MAAETGLKVFEERGRITNSSTGERDGARVIPNARKKQIVGTARRVRSVLVVIVTMQERQNE